jgi:hypothetical protein
MQGAPFLLAANPFVFTLQNDCYRQEVLGFDTSAPVYGCANREPVFTGIPLDQNPVYQGLRQTIEPVTLLSDMGGFFVADLAGYGESYEGNSLMFERLDANAAQVDDTKLRADIAIGTLRAEAGILTFGLSEGALSLAEGDYQKARNEFAISAATLGLARYFGGANVLDEMLPSLSEREALMRANKIRAVAQGERAAASLARLVEEQAAADKLAAQALMPGKPCPGGLKITLNPRRGEAGSINISGLNSPKAVKNGQYSTKIQWGIHELEARPFGPGYFGRRIPQGNPAVDAFELKINPNNESFYLPHPEGGFVQFENLVGSTVQDGKLILKTPSFYHVEELPSFAQSKVLAEAARQIEAAQAAGLQVEWLVSDQRAASQLSRLFADKNTSIKITFTPAN